MKENSAATEFVGTPQVLRAINSSLAERLIYEQGPLTKPDLARLTKLSLPTVSKLVDDLVADGTVAEAGLAGRGAGRKAVLYVANKDSGCLLALYYRWGSYAGRVTDVAGNTLHEALFPIDDTTCQTALSSTASALKALAELAPRPVKAMGVGVPGAVLPDGRLLGIPKIAVWEGFRLSEALAGLFPWGVVVENDAKLSAVGYYRTHLKDQFANIVYIYAGNGMGSGIIINGKLYRGAANFSGEFGFMAPLDAQSPPGDYTAKGGYLESLLGKYVDPDRGEYHMRDTPGRREIVAGLLAAAAANYIAVLNPDVIVFGGEAFGDQLLREIRRQLSLYIPAASAPSILHDTSGDTGMEGLVLTCRSYITTHMQVVQNAGV